MADMQTLYARSNALEKKYEDYRWQVFAMLHRVYEYKQLVDRCKSNYSPDLEQQVVMVKDVLKGFEILGTELRTEYDGLLAEIEQLKKDCNSPTIVDAEFQLAKVIPIRQELVKHEATISDYIKEDL